MEKITFKDVDEIVMKRRGRFKVEELEKLLRSRKDDKEGKSNVSSSQSKILEDCEFDFNHYADLRQDTIQILHEDFVTHLEFVTHRNIRTLKYKYHLYTKVLNLLSQKVLRVEKREIVEKENRDFVWKTHRFLSTLKRGFETDFDNLEDKDMLIGEALILKHLEDYLSLLPILKKLKKLVPDTTNELLNEEILFYEKFDSIYRSTFAKKLHIDHQVSQRLVYLSWKFRTHKSCDTKPTNYFFYRDRNEFCYRNPRTGIEKICLYVPQNFDFIFLQIGDSYALTMNPFHNFGVYLLFYRGLIIPKGINPNMSRKFVLKEYRCSENGRFLVLRLNYSSRWYEEDGIEGIRTQHRTKTVVFYKEHPLSFTFDFPSSEVTLSLSPGDFLCVSGNITHWRKFMISRLGGMGTMEPRKMMKGIMGSALSDYFELQNKGHSFVISQEGEKVDLKTNIDSPSIWEKTINLLFQMGRKNGLRDFSCIMRNSKKDIFYYDPARAKNNNFLKFSKIFQEVVISILFANKQSSTDFSRIPHDVVLHKIVPFLSESEVFFTVHEDVKCLIKLHICDEISFCPACEPWLDLEIIENETSRLDILTVLFVFSRTLESSFPETRVSPFSIPYPESSVESKILKWLTITLDDFDGTYSVGSRIEHLLRVYLLASVQSKSETDPVFDMCLIKELWNCLFFSKCLNNSTLKFSEEMTKNIFDVLRIFSTTEASLRNNDGHLTTYVKVEQRTTIRKMLVQLVEIVHLPFFEKKSQGVTKVIYPGTSIDILNKLCSYPVLLDFFDGDSSDKIKMGICVENIVNSFQCYLYQKKQEIAKKDIEVPNPETYRRICDSMKSLDTLFRRWKCPLITEIITDLVVENGVVRDFVPVKRVALRKKEDDKISEVWSGMIFRTLQPSINLSPFIDVNFFKGPIFQKSKDKLSLTAEVKSFILVVKNLDNDVFSSYVPTFFRLITNRLVQVYQTFSRKQRIQLSSYNFYAILTLVMERVDEIISSGKDEKVSGFYDIFSHKDIDGKENEEDEYEEESDFSSGEETMVMTYPPIESLPLDDFSKCTSPFSIKCNLYGFLLVQLNALWLPDLRRSSDFRSSDVGRQRRSDLYFQSINNVNSISRSLVIMLKNEEVFSSLKVDGTISKLISAVNDLSVLMDSHRGKWRYMKITSSILKNAVDMYAFLKPLISEEHFLEEIKLRRIKEVEEREEYLRVRLGQDVETIIDECEGFLNELLRVGDIPNFASRIEKAISEQNIDSEEPIQKMFSVFPTKFYRLMGLIHEKVRMVESTQGFGVLFSMNDDARKKLGSLLLKVLIIPTTKSNFPEEEVLSFIEEYRRIFMFKKEDVEEFRNYVIRIFKNSKKNNISQTYVNQLFQTLKSLSTQRIPNLCSIELMKTLFVDLLDYVVGIGCKSRLFNFFDIISVLRSYSLVLFHKVEEQQAGEKKLDFFDSLFERIFRWIEFDPEKRIFSCDFLLFFVRQTRKSVFDPYPIKWAVHLVQLCLKIFVWDPQEAIGKNLDNQRKRITGITSEKRTDWYEVWISFTTSVIEVLCCFFSECSTADFFHRFSPWDSLVAKLGNFLASEIRKNLQRNETHPVWEDVIGNFNVSLFTSASNFCRICSYFIKAFPGLIISEEDEEEGEDEQDEHCRDKDKRLSVSVWPLKELLSVMCDMHSAAMRVLFERYIHSGKAIKTTAGNYHDVLAFVSLQVPFEDLLLEIITIFESHGRLQELLEVNSFSNLVLKKEFEGEAKYDDNGVFMKKYFQTDFFKSELEKKSFFDIKKEYVDENNPIVLMKRVAGILCSHFFRNGLFDDVIKDENMLLGGSGTNFNMSDFLQETPVGEGSTSVGSRVTERGDRRRRKKKKSRMGRQDFVDYSSPSDSKEKSSEEFSFISQEQNSTTSDKDNFVFGDFSFPEFENQPNLQANDPNINNNNSVFNFGKIEEEEEEKSEFGGSFLGSDRGTSGGNSNVGGGKDDIFHF